MFIAILTSYTIINYILIDSWAAVILPLCLIVFASFVGNYLNISHCWCTSVSSNSSSNSSTNCPSAGASSFSATLINIYNSLRLHTWLIDHLSSHLKHNLLAFFSRYLLWVSRCSRLTMLPAEFEGVSVSGLTCDILTRFRVRVRVRNEFGKLGIIWEFGYNLNF